MTSLLVRPLTVLAGANSSGKSSVLQALLLLKQTLDGLPYDSGALKLDGPNVAFSDAGQFLSYSPGTGRNDEFEIQLGAGDERIELLFGVAGPGVDLTRAVYASGPARLTITREGFSLPELMAHPWFKAAPKASNAAQALRFACFLLPGHAEKADLLPPKIGALIDELRAMIHLAGHRGNPERLYPKSAPGEAQAGLFHERTAAIIARWAETRDARLEELNAALSDLGLTWKADAKIRDAASIEVRVARTARPKAGGAHDLVSVADVGFGVSQTLPVVVALTAARPDQLVYIEQPEIHLHPRAQKGMADLIVRAVKRGARIVVETHSQIVLARFQTLIATAEIQPDSVVAHWFERDPATGFTKITTCKPDASGAFGDWPADFDDVAAEVDAEYAQAAFERLGAAQQ